MVGWIVDKETRTDRKKGPRDDTKKRKRQTDERRTDVQSRRAKVLSVKLVKPVCETLWGNSGPPQVSIIQQKLRRTAAGQPDC